MHPWFIKIQRRTIKLIENMPTCKRVGMVALPPVLDNAETQVVDIMKPELDPGLSPIPSTSPLATADSMRKNFQHRPSPQTPAVPVLDAAGTSLPADAKTEKALSVSGHAESSKVYIYIINILHFPNPFDDSLSSC